LKFERFDLTVLGALGLIVLAIGGVWLAGDRVGARIVRTLPETNTTISPNGQVIIEFAQAMNQSSVESGFSLTPSLAGRFIWKDKTMTFVPQSPFERGKTYTAQLAAGVVSATGQSVKQAQSWQFNIRKPSVIYISPSSEMRELWSLTPGGQPQPLTSTNGGIYDFAVSPTGDFVAYSVLNKTGGLDLWEMDRDGSNQKVIVDCAADRCTAPSWSPDGARLAYSRETQAQTAGGPHGAPRVWIFDTTTGQNNPLYQDSQMLGYGPSWSPDGKRLAAWDGGAGSIRVLDLQTSETMLLPSQSGSAGTWSPDGATMLYNDISLVGEQPYVKMFVAEFATKKIRPAFSSDTQLTDYSVPMYSPDGKWIAAGVKTPSSGLGSDLWVLYPDGTHGQVVADDPQYTYGSYKWDPWSQSLIFQRFALGVAFAKPEVLLWSLADNSTQVLAQDASLPEWLP
jgi:TolB protein